MSVGHARMAIRRMLAMPRARRPWTRKTWLAVLVTSGPIGLVGRYVGRLWTWIGVVTVFGFGIGAVPLFGVLGFELATATSVLAAILGLDLGSALAREMQRMPAPGVMRSAYPGRTLVGSTLVAAGLPAAIILIPAVISAVRGIWLPTCDWWFGIETYLAMPVCTALLAGALGHAMGVIVGPRRILGAAVAQLPLVVVAVLALHRFYSAPPVFTYNAILGYFPGNLYDENVKLTWTLAWARLEQLLWVLAILALVAAMLDVPRYRIGRAPRPSSRRIGPVVVALAVLVAGGVLHTQSGRLGYAVDVEDIEEALGGRVETAHFVIHYAQTPEIEADIALIAADHEFRYAQVVAQLGTAPPGKLHSFYFSDRDQKGRWMGARDVEMAKPWRREIYLDHRPFPHGSLRHEIAHAVASEFGDPLFGVAARRVLGIPLLASPGLIEGLAVAIDWPGGSDRMTPHEAVRTLQELGMAPSIRSLLTLQFFSVSSSAGYTTAGSFLRFLLDTYGAAKLRALYASGGEFTESYGKSLTVLEGEWRAMIEKIEIPAAAVEASRERFRSGSVFSRPCPHAIAARREQAMNVYVHGDRKGAIALMRDVCSDAPEEPRHLMELGDFLVSGDDHERAEALGLWTTIAKDVEHVTSTLRSEAFERLARAAANRGDWTQVRALIAEAMTLPVDSSERRQLEAESFALAHTGPAGTALRGYFWGTASRVEAPTWALLATLAEPDLGFAHYLLGLQQVAQADWTHAAAELDRSLTLGLPGLAFVKNAARRLAITAYRTHDAGQIADALRLLSGADMAEVDRLLAKDWAARLSFASHP